MLRSHRELISLFSTSSLSSHPLLFIKNIHWCWLYGKCLSFGFLASTFTTKNTQKQGLNRWYIKHTVRPWNCHRDAEITGERGTFLFLHTLFMLNKLWQRLRLINGHNGILSWQSTTLYLTRQGKEPSSSLRLWQCESSISRIETIKSGSLIRCSGQPGFPSVWVWLA